MSIRDALETATSIVFLQKAESVNLEALREHAAARRVESIRTSPLIRYGDALADVLKEMAESPRASAFFGGHQPHGRCMSPEHFYLDSVNSRLISPSVPGRQSVAGHNLHIDIKLKPSGDVGVEQVSLWVEIWRIGDHYTRLVRKRKTVSSPEDAAEFVEGIVANFVVELEQTLEVESSASLAPKL